MLDGLFSQSVCSFRMVGGQTLFLASNNGVPNFTILKRKKKNDCAAMATEQLVKKLNVYGIIIKTQSRCNGLYFTLLLLTYALSQALVVQTLDSAINQINHYPADK